MNQMTLDGKELTPKERLMVMRMNYYIELLNEVSLLRKKRIELIKNYKNEVDYIDKQIKIIDMRQQNEKKG